MVRGNWQKRVERTEARRREAKQKKAKSEEKRIYKGYAQQALNFLDKQIDSIRRRSNDAEQWIFHIWTDTLPSESPPIWEILDNYHNAAADGCDPMMMMKGRGKKGRGKSDKKVHPRSKEAAEPSNSATETSVSAPLLCKSQFFSGKCHDPPQKRGNKGGCGCRRVHYNNKRLKTLAAVLVGTNENKQQQEELNKAEEACTINSTTTIDSSSDHLENKDAMEMVYYLSLSIPKNIGTNDKNEEEETTDNNPEEETTSDTDQPPNQSNTSNTIAHLITENLNTNGCSVASIVYMVLSSPFNQNTLLYDRNREGIVITDFAAQVLGTSGGEAASEEEDEGRLLAENLSITILEHILSFTEAPAVAAAAQVCTAWNREIGSCSPALWKNLLQQRNWPIPASIAGTVGGDDEAAMDESLLHDKETSAALAMQLRTAFVLHYSVLRDLRAVSTALTAMLTKRSCPEHEMTYQAFSTRRGAPQSPNNCVAIEIWGPNQVLAAYSDNTLRLFQAQARGGYNNNNPSSGSSNNNTRVEKSCRELLCRSIDPYRGTKKKTCYLEAVGLDEDVVGCLCSVSDESSDDKTPHILVIIQREDLLEDGAPRVIDVEEAVMNYVLSLEEVDHSLLRVNDFLALGGDPGEVEFIVSQSMAACGFGRFMIEVAISIPINEDDENEDEDLGDMRLLCRKLFLFSANLGAIVWMGDSSSAPNGNLPSRLEDMTIAFLRRTIGFGNRTSCTVASVSHALAPSVMSCEIEPSGHIDGHHVLGSSEWSRSQRLLGEGWSLRTDGKRPIVVTPTDIVVGDSLATQQNQNGERNYKATITFYSRFPGVDDGVASIAKLIVGENCTIDSMIGFRDDYVILLVRFFTETGFAAVDGGGGHWGTDRVARVFALTIHVPSRREIERMCLYEDFGLNKLTITVQGDTVACGVWLKGLIMTGPDVRSIGMSEMGKPVIVLEDAGNKASKKKDKKKRRSKGGGKKDGFARGQSLRG